jgi:hypothetical protein
MTSSPFCNAYSAGIMNHIWQLLSWGYNDSRIEVCSTDVQEPAITGFIAEAINKRFRKKPPKWTKVFFVHENKPEPSTSKRSGNSRLKPDIVIQMNVTGRPEFTFEAKRLKAKKFPAKQYTGTDGMGCFIFENYARGYSEAAMLGYVQSDSVEYWKETLLQEINGNSAALGLIPPQDEDPVIPHFPAKWVSRHNRPTMPPITLHHILLDYRGVD